MPKTTPVPCTKEEISKILEACQEDEFTYMLFRVAVKTGRRLGEYYDVKVKDVNFEKQIMMTKVLKRRMKVEKEAILDDELCRLIKSYILKRKLKLEDYLFREVSYRQIQNLVVKYSRRAGITHNVSFHNFRHFFVTSLIKQGFSHDQVAKLTGHSSISTISIYDHTVASDIAEKARVAMREF